MSQTQKTAYPLCWPEGWPRTVGHRRQESRFLKPVRNGGYGGCRRHSIDEARRLLADELDRLGARDCILSSNLRLRIDGNPMSGQAQPSDVGVAVYFKLKGREVSMACDKWRHVECNIYAIAKHIEALRGQQRWGVGNVDQAFRGYMALPAVGQTSGDNPWQVLGVAINASEEQINEAFRAKAKVVHPDNPETGNVAEFHRLQQAHHFLMQNARSQAKATSVAATEKPTTNGHE